VAVELVVTYLNVVDRPQQALPILEVGVVQPEQAQPVPVVDPV